MRFHNASDVDVFINGTVGCPFNSTAVVVLTTFVYIFLCVGIVFNVAVIIGIKTCKDLHGIFHKFMLQTCYTNLVSAIISPFVLHNKTYGYKRYGLPEYFCKMSWVVEMMNVCWPGLYMSAIAIFRFFAINWPIRYRNVDPQVFTTVLIIIRVVGIVFMVPLYQLVCLTKHNLTMMSPPACDLNMAERNEITIYSTFCILIFVFMPAIANVVFSVLAVFKVYRRTNILVKTGMSSKFIKEHRHVKMATQLAVIFVCYALGYIPFSAYGTWAYHLPATLRKGHNVVVGYWWFWAVYVLRRLIEVVAPICYLYSSRKIRQRLREMISTKKSKMDVKGYGTLK